MPGICHQCGRIDFLCVVPCIPIHCFLHHNGDHGSHQGQHSRNQQFLAAGDLPDAAPADAQLAAPAAQHQHRGSNRQQQALAQVFFPAAGDGHGHHGHRHNQPRVGNDGAHRVAHSHIHLALGGGHHRDDHLRHGGGQADDGGPDDEGGDIHGPGDPAGGVHKGVAPLDHQHHTHGKQQTTDEHFHKALSFLLCGATKNETYPQVSCR